MGGFGGREWGNSRLGVPEFPAENMSGTCGRGGAGLKGDSELVPGETRELPWEVEASQATLGSGLRWRP